LLVEQVSTIPGRSHAVDRRYKQAKCAQDACECALKNRCRYQMHTMKVYIHMYAHTDTCTRACRQDVLRLDRLDATCSNVKINVAGRTDAFLRIIIIIDIAVAFRNSIQMNFQF